ncbi:hypothetical protein L484_025573 [Morus notabilis]|uniref:Pentatricopeptide repeat-containing protein n=1 Tax=Morus notabilis TaxID=981085 RepID=W9RJ52_9ROSA|nr:pentatricopeptide repeat-containing protein At2g45350, chloroplastic [Morus notabilis]EXB76219.1 hypothetical protein L484_025573 [Morus notabilis]
MLLCANTNRPWFPTLVLLQKCKTLNAVNQIHARMITTGSINNCSLSAKIVLAFVSSPHPPLAEFARYVFFSRHAFGNEDDPFLWNAVIKSYSHGCDPKQAFVMFCMMLENGVRVDKFSFSLILKACGRLGLVKEGLQIHGLLKKMEIGSDLYLQNGLVSWYLRCGCVEFARQVFDGMQKRDSVSYNSMIDGYVKCGMIDLARELFDCMPLEEKNLVTWNSMISGYAQSDLEFAWELFETMPERDSVSWNTMINGYVKRGKIEDARSLFNRMPKRDIVSWANLIDGYSKLGRIHVARSLFNEMPDRDVVACNAMMAGYVGNGYFMEGLEIFRHMQNGDVSPDVTTLLIALSAVAQLGHIEKGVALHFYIQENGVPLGRKLGVALIDMYAKCGSIDKAIAVFEGMEERSVDHWNAMIGGYAIHGLGELAFCLLMEMERLSVKPDDITFIGVLNACGHAGLVKEGLMCFELMRRVHKVEPKLQHYGCIVDMLGRAGHVEEARRFIEEMPIEPNDVVWRTLLSACKSHKKFDIGEPIAKNLIQKDSCNPSFYVLLSNMYAGLGMWGDVFKVRMMMRERNVTKLPGCSRIELEGVVHEFMVQDKSHPQITEIYSMLNGLSTYNSESEVIKV